MNSGSNYVAALSELAALRPRMARALQKAEQLRTHRLQAYMHGARLAGLEQLLNYLEAARAAYETRDDLKRLTFVLTRAIADFETAVEATLSGYQGVASDAMRDVMEIEYLLLDFAAHLAHIDEWLECDRSTRLNKFAPQKVRYRLATAGLAPFSDNGWEPVDYRAHSETLHVTPQVSLISARGIEARPDESLLSDVGAQIIPPGGAEMFR